MVHYLLAHVGEAHETTSEASKHASSSTVTIATTQFFWLILILAPLLLLLIMRALHIKGSLQLLVISGFLIIFSVVSYQNPGVYSAVALSLGFGIIFTQTILGLSARD